MSLTKIPLAYLNFIAVIFGAFDFVLDRERKLIESSLILVGYSKTFVYTVMPSLRARANFHHDL